MMVETTTQVLVFKTNIDSDEDKGRMKDLLHAHTQIHEASVDTEDIDKVLRVVAGKIEATEIINLVKEQGFFCTELE